MYWDQKAKVRVGKENSRVLKIERGVRQGCILSPILFNLYSEYMIQEALGKLDGSSFNRAGFRHVPHVPRNRGPAKIVEKFLRDDPV